MKDDARAASELEALRAEFAAYRTEAEAKIAELESRLHNWEISTQGAAESAKPIRASSGTRKPRPTKGK